jgi:c-di-GMP-related signal transduction protein
MGLFMVGRQPIFDGALNVQGYELLFGARKATGPTPPP